MAVIRFTLDGPSTLDDVLYGLDGGAAFILDSSTLDGDHVLDGGQFLTVATGAATLGAMSVTASATITHSATASAELGELIAEIIDGTATISATFTAELGGLAATTTATVALPATASAGLGELAATAITTVSHTVTATTELGTLSATANSLPTPPPTPAPSGGRQFYAQPRRKKIEPEPTIEPPTIKSKQHYAVVTTSLTGIKSQATSTITFSILEDDAEILLMV